MILLNFSAPFKPIQIQQAESCLHETIDRIIEFQIPLDVDQTVLKQFEARIRKFPLSDEELRGEPIVVCLPSQNYLAVLVLAYLGGRMGYLPPIFRTRMMSMGILPIHEVVEMLDPQAVLDGAKFKE